jgi:hypothetical protein
MTAVVMMTAMSHFDDGEDDDNKKEVRNKTQFSFPVADHV